MIALKLDRFVGVFEFLDSLGEGDGERAHAFGEGFVVWGFGDEVNVICLESVIDCSESVGVGFLYGMRKDFQSGFGLDVG